MVKDIVIAVLSIFCALNCWLIGFITGVDVWRKRTNYGVKGGNKSDSN